MKETNPNTTAPRITIKMIKGNGNSGVGGGVGPLREIENSCD